MKRVQPNCCLPAAIIFSILSCSRIFSSSRKFTSPSIFSFCSLISTSWSLSLSFSKSPSDCSWIQSFPKDYVRTQHRTEQRNKIHDHCAYPSCFGDNILQVFNDFMLPLNFFLLRKEVCFHCPKSHFATQHSACEVLLSIFSYSYFSFLQFHVSSFQHKLLVHLHPLGKVVYMRQLFAQLPVL